MCILIGRPLLEDGLDGRLAYFPNLAWSRDWELSAVDPLHYLDPLWIMAKRPHPVSLTRFPLARAPVERKRVRPKGHGPWSPWATGKDLGVMLKPKCPAEKTSSVSLVKPLSLRSLVSSRRGVLSTSNGCVEKDDWERLEKVNRMHNKFTQSQYRIQLGHFS